MTVDHEAAARRGHATLDVRSQDAKARKIEHLLGLAPKLGGLRLLEIGTGSGGIASYFATHGSLECDVDAVDVHDHRQAKDGYKFTRVSGVELPFDDRTFDVIISNHVIEHVGPVDAQRRHLHEIRRVMKSNGIGYLAVPNRWQLVEPHFKLAFLSWLPERWRTPYLRARGRGVLYDCRPLTVNSLERLLSDTGFSFEQQLAVALRATFELERPKATIYRAVLKHAPDSLYRTLRYLFPTLIYVLSPVRIP